MYLIRLLLVILWLAVGWLLRTVGSLLLGIAVRLAALVVVVI